MDPPLGTHLQVRGMCFGFLRAALSEEGFRCGAFVDYLYPSMLEREDPFWYYGYASSRLDFRRRQCSTIGWPISSCVSSSSFSVRCHSVSLPPCFVMECSLPLPNIQDSGVLRVVVALIPREGQHQEVPGSRRHSRCRCIYGLHNSNSHDGWFRFLSIRDYDFLWCIVAFFTNSGPS